MVPLVFSGPWIQIALQPGPIGQSNHGGIVPVERKHRCDHVFDERGKRTFRRCLEAVMIDVALHDGGLHRLVHAKLVLKVKHDQRPGKPARLGNLTNRGPGESFFREDRFRCLYDDRLGGIRIPHFVGGHIQLLSIRLFLLNS